MLPQAVVASFATSASPPLPLTYCLLSAFGTRRRRQVGVGIQVVATCHHLQLLLLRRLLPLEGVALAVVVVVVVPVKVHLQPLTLPS